MSYIKKEDREDLDEAFKYLYTIFANRGFKGNLNYLLFKIAKYNCDSYKDFSDFIGELECAKLEIYRRFIGPYETKKIEQNGDVE